jgi:ubiquitin C
MTKSRFELVFMLSIEDKEEIPPVKQRLNFGSVVLENGKTLQEHSIQKDSTIHLTYKMGGGNCPCCGRKAIMKMQLSVETPTGEHITIEIDSSDLSENIKLKINEKVGIYPISA